MHAHWRHRPHRIAPADDADSALAGRVREAVWVRVVRSIPHGFTRKEAVMTKFLQKREAADPFAFMRRVAEESGSRIRASPTVRGLPELQPRMWVPAIEVFERDEKFVVRVDLPGLKKEEVRIEVTHDELTIEGERKGGKGGEGRGPLPHRAHLRQILRRIGIPEHVKAEGAIAVFKNGVLEESRCRRFRCPRRRNAPSPSRIDAGRSRTANRQAGNRPTATTGRGSRSRGCPFVYAR